MSETRHRPRGRWAAELAKRPRFETAEECIYPMPTPEQVAAAGYLPPELKLEAVRREREEFIARFNADPAFAAEARARAAEEWDEMQRRSTRE